MFKVRRIIIDTDPGIDDALAIMFALGCPELSVEGITIVSGNVPVNVGTRNALTLLELIGRTDIPVARGAALPLRRALVTAEWVHGKDGMANMNLPAPSIKPVEGSAVEWIRKKLLDSDEKITVVAIGPLTNLGMLYCLNPDAFLRIEEIVFMGGAAFCGGNTTASAEFNIYVDPDAAKLVVNSGVPITMVGLDVTEKTVIYSDDVSILEGNSSRVADFAKKLLIKAFSAIPGRTEIGGLCLHDPLTVGVAINPEIVKTKKYRLAVETEGELTLGETIVDDRPYSKVEPNAKVAIDVDSNGFKKWFFRILNS